MLRDGSARRSCSPVWTRCSVDPTAISWCTRRRGFGAVEIEAEVSRRLESEVRFAMCYADLDHFKNSTTATRTTTATASFEFSRRFCTTW